MQLGSIRWEPSILAGRSKQRIRNTDPTSLAWPPKKLMMRFYKRHIWNIRFCWLKADKNWKFKQQILILTHPWKPPKLPAGYFLNFSSCLKLGHGLSVEMLIEKARFQFTINLALGYFTMNQNQKICICWHLKNLLFTIHTNLKCLIILLRDTEINIM